MELPITRPSQMSYADEIDFNELLGRLESERFNGFIRVTSKSSEGYILFNNGKKAAASFEAYSGFEAVDEMKSIVDDNKTLIEVFDLKKTQMKYLMDLNKVFIINAEPEIPQIIEELKKDKQINEIEEKTPEKETEVEKTEIQEPLKVPEKEDKDIIEDKTVPKIETENNEVKEKLEAKSGTNITDSSDIKSSDENIIKEDTEKEPLSTENNIEVEDPVIGKVPEQKTDDAEFQADNEFIEPGVEAEAVDREELMKKYGLKDVAEEEVDNILETYKGGTISDDDVEKIELTLMNKVKKSILGIPKIKGTEVMVFLDNVGELSGNINIIAEYESKGFISRIMGESRDLENLRRQIINITQMEIKKSFRGYPEIVEDFEINVEIS